MKLLTVIVNYKTADMTLESTQSAVDAMIYLEDDWQIVIVDNDSQDGSFDKIEQSLKEKCRELPGEGWEKVTVVQSNHNGGFGAGNNYAMRKALANEPPPEYFYLLNSDAFPEDNAIRLLADYLDDHEDVGIAGSYIHGIDDVPHTTAFRFPSFYSELQGSMHLGFVSRLLRNYVVPIGIPKTTREVDWLAGASMMMRSSMLKEIGLFDETFFLYFEETDLCKRADNKNWKTVYVKESRVGHIGSVSTGMKTWERVPGYWLDSRKYYFCKNHGYLYAAAATLARLLGGMTWRVRAVIQKKTNAEPKYFLQDLLRHWFSR
jgi:GT2 family glycosyltransferase